MLKIKYKVVLILVSTVGEIAKKYIAQKQRVWVMNLLRFVVKVGLLSLHRYHGPVRFLVENSLVP